MSKNLCIGEWSLLTVTLSSKEETLKEIRQRFAKDFLDICILRLIHIHPCWGYEIIMEVDKMYEIKKGPSTIYPLLSLLEAKGFIKGGWRLEKGRKKRIYKITPSGIEFIDSFYNFLREQLSIFDYYKKTL